MNGLSKDRSNNLKLVAVGDGSVGKTSILISYTLNQFPGDYIYTPTVFDTYAVSVMIGGESYVLSLFDTAGQEDYMYLRTLAYPNTDIFLVCFAVNNKDSLENAERVWIPEIKRSRHIYNSSASFLLVGTKNDFRSDSKQEGRLIPYKTGAQVAKRTGALGYVECSALTQMDLKNVFDTAIVATIEKRDEDLLKIMFLDKANRKMSHLFNCFKISKLWLK